MDALSDLVTKLENQTDLEVSIIRETKINKVLKAILKLDNIPREAEFNFKARSQALLDRWTKILATDTPVTPTAPAAPTNGVHVADEEGHNNNKKKEKKAPNGTEDATEEAGDAAEKPTEPKAKVREDYSGLVPCLDS